MIPHHIGEEEAEAQRRTYKVANHGKRKRAAYLFLVSILQSGYQVSSYICRVSAVSVAFTLVSSVCVACEVCRVEFAVRKRDKLESTYVTTRIPL